MQVHGLSPVMLAGALKSDSMWSLPPKSTAFTPPTILTCGLVPSLLKVPFRLPAFSQTGSGPSDSLLASRSTNGRAGRARTSALAIEATKMTSRVTNAEIRFRCMTIIFPFHLC